MIRNQAGRGIKDMAIIVNGERIDGEVIQAEMERMRPMYRQTFADQSHEEQNARLREWARENVIEQVLLRQAAAAEIDPPSQDEVTKKLKHMQEGKSLQPEQMRIPSELDPEQENAFKQDIGKQIQVERFIERLCADLPAPSEEQARAYYRDNKGEFTIPEQVRAAHIVKHVTAQTLPEAAEKAMRGIYAELQSGSPFEELASQHSDCPDNAGDLGCFSRGQMVQEFEDVVFSLEPGEISEVFQTSYGFHIAKVYERRLEHVLSFDDVKDRIADRLQHEQRDRKVEEFLDKRRALADVKTAPQPKTLGNRKKKKRTNDSKPGSKVKPMQSILVKPAGPDCNMRCRYCFYLGKEDLFTASGMHRMSEEVLEAMIRSALSGPERQINFGWQGGEPSLMRLPFYRRAVEFQKKYGRAHMIGNGFQTNGLLIDEEWADFFRENKFLVGLSLDGPKHIHDQYRVRPNGKGTWDRVMKSARLLLEKEVQVNALVVLNDYSVRFPAEIYRFHRDLGLRFMQFIPCVETVPGDAGKLMPFSVPPDEFGFALKTLFELWMDDFQNGRPTTSIRFFDSLFHRYVGMEAPECTLLEECGIYVVVEHNGCIYSCDFFVDPQWKLGNVLQDDILNALNSPKQKEFGKKKSHFAPVCRECDWLYLCRGGCPKDRIEGLQHANYLCPGYKLFFKHAHKRFEELAQHWRSQQDRQPASTPRRVSLKK